MRAHNKLELIRVPVPKAELPLEVTGEETTAAGCPGTTGYSLELLGAEVGGLEGQVGGGGVAGEGGEAGFRAGAHLGTDRGGTGEEEVLVETVL